MCLLNNQMCLLDNKTKSNNYTCSKEHIIKDTVIIIISYRRLRDSTHAVSLLVLFKYPSH